MKVEIRTKTLKAQPSTDLPANVIEEVVDLLERRKQGSIEIKFSKTVKIGEKQVCRTIRVRKITVRIQTTFKFDSRVFDKKTKAGSIFLCRVGETKSGIGIFEFSRRGIPGKTCCRFGFDDLVEHVEIHAIDAEGAFTAYLKGLGTRKFEESVKGPANDVAALDRKESKARAKLIQEIGRRVTSGKELALAIAGGEVPEQAIRGSQFRRLRAKKREAAKKKKTGKGDKSSSDK